MFSADQNYPSWLEGQHSAVRDVLTLQLYRELYGLKSSSGCNIDDVIRPATCVPASDEKVSGAIACDQDCYETFAPFFRRLLPLLQHHYKPDQQHESNKDMRKLRVPKLSGERVKRVQLTLYRSIAGFSMPQFSSRAERRAVCHIAQSALAQLSGPHTGMFEKIADALQSEPTSLLNKIAPGEEVDGMAVWAGRLHPVAAKEEGSEEGGGEGTEKAAEDTADPGPGVAVSVNGDEHLYIATDVLCDEDASASIGAVLKAFFAFDAVLQAALEADEEAFAVTEHLGNIVGDPGMLGTAFTPSITLQLTSLEYPALVALARPGATVVADPQVPGTYQVTAAAGHTLHCSEVQLAQAVLDTVADICAADAAAASATPATTGAAKDATE